MKPEYREVGGMDEASKAHAQGGSPRGETMRTVRSVGRAVSIMEALLVAPDGLRMAELSERLGLHKTTVLRLLKTLMSIHLVRRTADERYHWEPLRWMAVAQAFADGASSYGSVQGLLEELASLTGHTAALCVPDGQDRATIVVAAAVPGAPLADGIRLRLWAPLHACAAGKLHLATLPEEQLARYLQSGLQPLTPHTITDPDRLRKELAVVRDHGYATASQEFCVGSAALSVAVHDDTAAMTGALMLVAQQERFEAQERQRWLPALRSTSERFSRMLYRPG